MPQPITRSSLRSIRILQLRCVSPSIVVVFYRLRRRAVSSSPLGRNIVSIVLLLKSTLQGVTDTQFVQVMDESNDSAHTGGTNISALMKLR